MAIQMVIQRRTDWDILPILLTITTIATTVAMWSHLQARALWAHLVQAQAILQMGTILT